MKFKLKDLIDPKIRTDMLKTLLSTLFQLHKHAYRTRNVNYPNVQCIFALWHAHQCGVYSIKNKTKTNLMISRSLDGDIIAYASENLGFKTVRGSKTRGGAAATLELVERLKKGEYGVITIDGPRGPRYVVKKGIVEIARMTGVPIVPMAFYCGKNGWLEFNTWDKFRYPVPFRKSLTLYGDPIYVPNDTDEEGIEKYRKEVEDRLFELQNRAENDYKNLVKIAE